jgi:CHAD domain-containing protein
VSPAVRERELKLAVPTSFVVPNLADDGLGVIDVQELPELSLTSTYYDTSDLRLARSGVTLRYRTGEEIGPAWTLKLSVPGHDASERDEHTFPGAPDSVPSDATDLVTAFIRTAPILPVASLTTRRHRWLLCAVGDTPLAELVDDEVSVLDGSRVIARFRELELESRGPDLAALKPIADRLRRAGAVLAEPVPKAIRALGPRAVAEPDVTPQTVSPGDAAGRAIQAALASGLGRLIANDPATRLGDAEGLHQMRVAARRLRSDLRTFRPIVDQAWAKALSDELRWLGSALGEVRDADVQLIRLETLAPDVLAALEPVSRRLRTHQSDARESLLADVRTERYVTLLERLVDAVRNPMLVSRATDPNKKVLPKLLRRAWKRLEPQAERLDSASPNDAYHAVRIRAKRVRYAAEAIAPALGKAALTRLAEAATDLQDLLGEMHDEVVMADQVTGDANSSDDPPFAYAAGRLVERCLSRAGEARSRYPKTWRRVRKAARRI